MPDPYASGPVALTLAWLVALPLVAAATLEILEFLAGKGEVARPFKLWILFCLLFLAPGRYLLFQTVLGTTYLVQSWTGFLSGLLLAAYVPIVFGILYFLGIGVPLIVTIQVLGDEMNRGGPRYLAGAVVLAVTCLLGSLLFYATLPFAAKTVHWLPAHAVIKATNGPTAVVFDYLVAPLGPFPVPEFFELTPQDAIALRRSHVAGLYLGDREMVRFLRLAYPEVYEAITDVKTE